MRLAIVCDRSDYETMSAHLSETPSIVCLAGDDPLADLGSEDIVILWNAGRNAGATKDQLRRLGSDGRRVPILAVATQWNSDNDSPELVLDRDALCARIGGEQVPLTPTQFSILEYLVQNRDSWRPPFAIIRDVLGTYHQKNTSLVRFHIHKLRAALGEYGALIRWQQGRGYMFTTSAAPHQPSKAVHAEAVNASP